jgi:hypothetical protein
MAKFVTVKHVALCRVGTWGASTGPTVITPDVMASMIEASTEVGRAVVKIGHRDPRFNNPVFDGDPVYGQVTNLSREGDVLYGDLVNVPEELAESMKSAYPNRSVEIAWGMKLKDAAGAVKKQFKAALIGLALLGRTPPAVQGLSALSLGDTIASGVTDADFVSAMGSFTLTDEARALETAIQKRNAGAELLSMEDGVATFKTSVGQYKCLYATLSDGSFAVSDTETANPEFPQPTFTNADSDVVNNGGTAAGIEPNLPKGASSMEFLQKLREKLGLPETATEDEIFEAATKEREAPKLDKDGKPIVETPAAGTPGAPAPAATVNPDGTPLVTAASAGETVQVSAAAFAELQTNFSASQVELQALRNERDTERRDGLMTSYLSSGVVHPTEIDYWRGQLDKDETATVAFLSARTPVIPVGEVGSEAARYTAAGFTSELSDDVLKQAMTEFGFVVPE